ncbi:hypothetical protein [Streptomyces phaeochromogenes]|uniref:hypothetical protein n=1 Tax=Streptomyces phaeochromogenes TaxID=1923 RepID=UPI0033DF7956
MGRAGNCWSAPRRAWLSELPLPDTARGAVADRLEVIDALQVVIDRLDAALAQAAKADPRVKARAPQLAPGRGIVRLDSPSPHGCVNESFSQLCCGQLSGKGPVVP